MRVCVHVHRVCDVTWWRVGILTPYVQLLSSSPALARACSPIAPDILSRLGNDDGVFGAHTIVLVPKFVTVVDHDM